MVQLAHSKWQCPGYEIELTYCRSHWIFHLGRHQGDGYRTARKKVTRFLVFLTSLYTIQQPPNWLHARVNVMEGQPGQQPDLQAYYLGYGKGEGYHIMIAKM